MGADTIPSNHRLAERVLIQVVRSGEWRIDAEGRIWTRSGTRAERRTRAGYLLVRKMIHGRRVVGCAHRLVQQFVHGDIQPGAVVNHKNGIKDDNRPENLEVVSYSDNSKHAHAMGLRDQRGLRNPSGKLSDEQVREIRRRRAGGEPLASIAPDFGVDFRYVSRLARGDARAAVRGAPIGRADGRKRPRHARTPAATVAGRLLDGREWSEVPDAR